MQNFNEIINEVIEDVENIDNIQLVIDIMQSYYNDLLEMGEGSEEKIIEALKEIGEENVIDKWIKPQMPKKEVWSKRLPYILNDLKDEANRTEVEDIILSLDSEINLEGLDYIKEARNDLIEIGEEEIANKWLIKKGVTYIGRRFKKIGNYNIVSER